jgi:hypothetical protein
MAVTLVSRRSFLKGVGAVAAAAVLTEDAAAPRAVWAAAPTGQLRFGVQTPPQHITYSDLVPVWREVDELGFDPPLFLTILSPSTLIPRAPVLKAGRCFPPWPRRPSEYAWVYWSPATPIGTLRS